MRGFSPRLILSKQVHTSYRARLAEVCQHPRLHDAMKIHAAANREAPPAADPYFAKYIGDAGNVLIEQAALYLHLVFEREGQGPGATLGKLQMIAYVHGFASPRRVTMYVKRMVQIGRLSYAADVSDKRVRRLLPSAALVATAQSNCAAILEAAGAIWPLAQARCQVLRDRQHFEEVFTSKLRQYLQGADPLRPFPDVRHFTSKDAGTFILSNLIFDCLEKSGRLETTTPVSLIYSDAAERWGVSRTHVRNVIEAAAARGLLSSLAEGGRCMHLTQRMVSAYEQHFACLMIHAHDAATSSKGGDC